MVSEHTHIHMIRQSKKSNLLNVRWRTTVQSKELSPILYDFEDLVKHSRFFRKRLGQKLCKSGLGHSKLSFLSRSPSYDQPVAKKQLAKSQVTDNCAVQGAVAHTAWFWRFGQTFTVFSENAWVKSAVNRDSDTPNYRFWADYMHMIRPVEKKATC